MAKSVLAKSVLVLGNRNYSSWSLRGWLLVRQAGLDVEEIVIPLRTPETRPSILRHSPAGKVPALVDDGLQVWDSLAIAEYCAERAPGAGIWPTDPAARAVARSVSAEMHSGFQALRGAWPMNMARAKPPLQPSADVAADIQRISDIWTDCRRRFGKVAGADGGDFLFGAWSAADAMYAPVCSRFVSYGAALDPLSEQYVAAVMAHPMMREWAAGAATETWTIPDIDAV